MSRLQAFDAFPFTIFKPDYDEEKPNMWLQSGRDNGYGPSGHFAAEDKRINIDFARGKFYDPLAHAFLDLMERDLGGHPDRFDPMGFRWIVTKDFKSSHILGGNVFVSGQSWSGENEGLGIQISMPNYQSLGFSIIGRTIILPAKTSQKFNWNILDDEEFERLMFRLYFEMSMTFDNVQWLQKTRAPDSGRDISAERVENGNRVLIQARHQSASINAMNINEIVVKAETWNPKFDEVIIVTTSAFTQEAVRWKENHNLNPGLRPTVTLEAGGHLEVMLSKNPQLISHTGLR